MSDHRGETMEATKQAAHTPGPWQAKEYRPFNDGADWLIEANGVHLADVFGESDPVGERTGRANAAFIVRACNAHDDLVAALREIASDSPLSHRQVQDIARAALVKAAA